jgi:hypothetical protein
MLQAHTYPLNLLALMCILLLVLTLGVERDCTMRSR